MAHKKNETLAGNEASSNDATAKVDAEKISDQAQVQQEQEVAQQSGSVSAAPLSHITLFPRLPTELRLRIWRLAFPRGRHVSLCTESELSRADLSLFHDGILTEPLPITLHINSESRAETLRHYQILYWSGVPEEYQGKNTGMFDRPLVINPKTDIAVLSFQIMSQCPWFIDEPKPEYKTCDDLAEWMEYLDEQLEGGLKSITSLQLIGETRKSLDDMQSCMFPDITEVEIGKYASFNGTRCGLEWFGALKELKISTGTLHERVAEEYQKEMVAWFKEYSAKISGWNIPKELIWRGV